MIKCEGCKYYKTYCFNFEPPCKYCIRYLKETEIKDRYVGMVEEKPPCEHEYHHYTGNVCIHCGEMRKEKPPKLPEKMVCMDSDLEGAIFDVIGVMNSIIDYLKEKEGERG